MPDEKKYKKTITKKGPTEPRQVIIKDRAQYEKRAQAYQDSLYLSQHPVFGARSLYDTPTSALRGPVTDYDLEMSKYDENDKKVFEKYHMTNAPLTGNTTLKTFKDLKNMSERRYRMLESPEDYRYTNRQEYWGDRINDYIDGPKYYRGALYDLEDVKPYSDPNYNIRDFNIHMSDGKSFDFKPMITPRVEPILGATKTEVPSKGMDLKVTTKNKVMKSLPRQIDKVAYDASGTKVYVTVNGQTSAINKTNFPAWKQANQGLWDAYIKNK